MNEPSEALKKKLWKEVRKEFPGDEMMQEIHFVRLLHYHQTKGMTAEERIRFYNRSIGNRHS
ncbi:MAG TPA: hypothetical protein VM658_20510 [bacterium]|nr:hypothetical protein [bacterium]